MTEGLFNGESFIRVKRLDREESVNILKYFKSRVETCESAREEIESSRGCAWHERGEWLASPDRQGANVIPRTARGDRGILLKCRCAWSSGLRKAPACLI